MVVDFKKKLNCDGSYISVKMYDNLYYFGNFEKILVYSIYWVDKLDEIVCKVLIVCNVFFKVINLLDENGFLNLLYI